MSTKKRRTVRNPRPPRDLLDFHLRWRDFRQLATAAKARAELSDEEQAVIHWLIELADRVGERDLG